MQYKRDNRWNPNYKIHPNLMNFKLRFQETKAMDKTLWITSWLVGWFMVKNSSESVRTGNTSEEGGKLKLYGDN